MLDVQGNRLGEIESVILDRQGEATGIVLDIGSWLEADKKIALGVGDLGVNAQGQATSKLTSAAADGLTRYRYREQFQKSGLLSESGTACGTQVGPEVKWISASEVG